jgi:predicted amidohydrolase
MSENNLKIGFFQADLIWQNPEKNREMFEKKFTEKINGHDLVILPEMFTTGFSMQNEEFAEEYNGESVAWLLKESQKHRCLIAGSIIFKENNNFYNRFLFAFPDGKLLHYDKRHLFRLADEHLHYKEGTKKLIFEFHGWKICPLICYDLRFPVWSRNTWNGDKADYDLLIYTANFPAARSLAWKTLLRARAIENLSYCIGVNRRGTDGKGIFYSGDSAAIDFTGEPLCELGEEQDFGEITLEKDKLEEYRMRFPAYKDADIFNLSITQKS